MSRVPTSRVSPILAVTIGALLLMLAEAFGKPMSPEGIGPNGLITDAGAQLSAEEVHAVRARKL